MQKESGLLARSFWLNNIIKKLIFLVQHKKGTLCAEK
jgi:hypothetical protein